MGNFIETLKRFMGNKNTVTILGVVAGILVLYGGYTFRINKAINPIKVPCAKTALKAKHLITEKDIAYINISKNMATTNTNIIQNPKEIIGKYVSYSTDIPANSLFYKESIIEDSERPDAAFANIKDNYTIFSLGVDLHTTYGNSIYPGNYIDLYLKAESDEGIIFGKLIESIEVLAVKDSRGNHLFQNTVETRTPSELLFAVEDKMYLLLMKALYIEGQSHIEIVPVPRNGSYTAKPGETSVASDYIVNYITAQSVTLPEDVGQLNENAVEHVEE